MINIIAALTKSRVIGKNNQMPWDIPEEFELFQSIIDGGVVIVGKKTWESIENPNPVSKKYIIVSTTLDEVKDATICKTLPEAINLAKTFQREIYICGGTKIYAEAIFLADKMYFSYIKQDYDGDTYFPELNQEDWEIESTKDYNEFKFVIYRRKNDRQT